MVAVLHPGPQLPPELWLLQPVLYLNTVDTPQVRGHRTGHVSRVTCTTQIRVTGGGARSLGQTVTIINHTAIVPAYVVMAR